MKKQLIAVLVAAAAAVLGARLSFFTVEEGRCAVVLSSRGEVSSVASAPGVHVKLPDPFQRYVIIDARGQTLNVPAPDPKAGSGAPSLGFDVVWRIVNPGAWWRSYRGSETQAARDLVRDVQAASVKEVARITEPSIVLRGDSWIASRVLSEIAPAYEAKGIKLEFVRVAEVRLSGEGAREAIGRTGRILGGQMAATGEIVRESASVLRAAAEAKAERTIGTAKSRAGLLIERGNAAADENYRKIEAVTGARGFASEMRKARAAVASDGKIVPMPEFPGTGKGSREP